MISNCLLIIIKNDHKKKMVEQRSIKATDSLLSIISPDLIKMEALKGVSKLLHKLYLCKETSSVSFFGLKIPNNLILTIILIPLYISFATMAAFCILKVDNIYKLLGVAYSLIGTWSMHCIYLSLIANESVLKQSLDHLKSLIRKRTLISVFENVFIFLNQVYSFQVIKRAARLLLFMKKERQTAERC